jgi:CheY-like chemotaxis protein
VRDILRGRGSAAMKHKLILEAADIGGLLKNGDRLYERGDETLDNWRALVIAWWRRYGSDDVSTAQLLALIEELGLDWDWGEARDDQGKCVRLGRALGGERFEMVFEDLQIRDMRITPSDDYHKRGDTGLQAIDLIRAVAPQAKIVVVTSHPELRAMAKGIHGYITKQVVGRPQMPALFHSIFSGELIYTNHLSVDCRDGFLEELRKRLTQPTACTADCTPPEELRPETRLVLLALAYMVDHKNEFPKTRASADRGDTTCDRWYTLRRLVGGMSQGKFEHNQRLLHDVLEVEHWEAAVYKARYYYGMIPKLVDMETLRAAVKAAASPTRAVAAAD